MHGALVLPANSSPHAAWATTGDLPVGQVGSQETGASPAGGSCGRCMPDARRRGARGELLRAFVSCVVAGIDGCVADGAKTALWWQELTAVCHGAVPQEPLAPDRWWCASGDMQFTCGFVETLHDGCLTRTVRFATRDTRPTFPASGRLFLCSQTHNRKILPVKHGGRTQTVGQACPRMAREFVGGHGGTGMPASTSSFALALPNFPVRQANRGPGSSPLAAAGLTISAARGAPQVQPW